MNTPRTLAERPSEVSLVSDGKEGWSVRRRIATATLAVLAFISTGCGLTDDHEPHPTVRHATTGAPAPDTVFSGTPFSESVPSTLASEYSPSPTASSSAEQDRPSLPPEFVSAAGQERSRLIDYYTELEGPAPGEAPFELRLAEWSFGDVNQNIAMASFSRIGDDSGIPGDGPLGVDFYNDNGEKRSLPEGRLRPLFCYPDGRPAPTEGPGELPSNCDPGEGPTWETAVTRVVIPVPLPPYDPNKPDAHVVKLLSEAYPRTRFAQPIEGSSFVVIVVTDDRRVLIGWHI